MSLDFGSQDYEDKAYNVKRAGGSYWQLGRLGPDLETEELQAKREKAEKLKQMAAAVREENMRKVAIAAAKPRADKPKEPTARDKALQFAKNIPKPEAAPPRQSPSPGGAQGEQGSRGRAPAKVSGAGAGAAKGGVRAGGAGKRAEMGSAGSEVSNPALAALEAQHAADQRRVEQIRAELARML